MPGFGSLAPNDWQDEEARANLAAIEAAKPAPGTWFDSIRSALAAPGRIVGSLASTPVENADAGAMMPETYVNPLVKGTLDAAGHAVSSGVTAPGDALAGKIPGYGPEGHTSPEMISRGFDTAALAGGGSAAGNLGKDAATAGTDLRVLGKQVLASDSGKPGAVAAAKKAVDEFASIRPERIFGEGPAWDKLSRDQQWAVHDMLADNPARREYTPQEYYEAHVKTSPADYPKIFGLAEDAGRAGAALDLASHAGGENVGSAITRDIGGRAGTPGLEKAQGTAARVAGDVKPLPGLPQKPLTVGGETYIPGPIASVHDVAKKYMESTGRPYERLDRYQPVDVNHAKAIAQAYDEMKHAPTDPKVRASYDAMIKETTDQYRALKDSGLKIEAIEPGMKDPYAESPRLAQKDVAENNHLWFFPTESGFGTEAAGRGHPLLKPTGEKLGERELLANDLFRIVHDYFGHLKEGNGFRAAGEDNAWRTHANMYSDLARPAMTTETRGQNSWLNYGPHGDFNRTASAADTHYAQQKVGLLPDWVMGDTYPGKPDWVAALKDVTYPGAKFGERYPETTPPTLEVNEKGREYFAKTTSPEAKQLAEMRLAAKPDIEAGNYTPYFDPAKRTDVDPSHYGEYHDTKTNLMKKPATREQYDAMAAHPDAVQRLEAAYANGLKQKDAAGNWYFMKQLEDEFVKEYGPKEGRAKFKERFADAMAATTGGADPTSNLLMAHYGNFLKAKGLPVPEAHQFPYPIGGQYAGANMEQFKKMIMEGGGIDPLKNEKRYNFSGNFLGRNKPTTIDEQMSGLFKPGMQKPPAGSYGHFEKVLEGLAAKHGVDPRYFQEVAWSGHRDLTELARGKAGGYKAKPMISHVNDAIERTHRVTGMPRNEIVRRGLVRAEIPLYSDSRFGSLIPRGNQDQR
jgi:hypothetical protein